MDFEGVDVVGKRDEDVGEFEFGETDCFDDVVEDGVGLFGVGTWVSGEVQRRS